MPLLPPRPATKTSLFASFLVVVFSATKVGGSRGSTSSFRAGTPSYTHHPKVQPGSSSIVHERSARVKYDSSADLPKGQGASIHRESEKGNSRKPVAGSGASRKLGFRRCRFSETEGIRKRESGYASMPHRK